MVELTELKKCHQCPEKILCDNCDMFWHLGDRASHKRMAITEEFVIGKESKFHGL